MPGSASNTHETELLQWSLGGGTAPARPTTWFIGLFTDAAGIVADQPTSEATNVNCPGYGRQQCTGFTITGNAAQNTAAIPDFTATGAWTTVRYFGIFDVVTGGRLLYWGSIPDKLLVNTDKLSFGASQITVNLD